MYLKAPIYSFDIAKYILCIFVITIHSFLLIENNIEDELARRFIYALITTAVPVFFLMSGYLFFSKCEAKGYHWKYLGKFMSRLAILYSLWYVILYTSDWVSLRVIGCVSWQDKLYNLLFLGGAHLWYIWSMLYVMPILFILRKWRCNVWVVLALGISAFFFFRLFSHYCSMEYPPCGWKVIAPLWTDHLFNVNGVCNALAFLSISLVFCHRPVIFSYNILLILFFLGLLGTILENSNALSVSMLLLSYSVFGIICSCNGLISEYVNRIGGNFYLSMRHQSTVIYFIHMLFIHIVSLFMPISTIIGYLMCVVICMLMAYMIVKVKNNFNILKYLM